jgi:hypothetical protein
MKMIVESMMECRLAGETEVLGENLPQRPTFVHHKIPGAHPGLNPGRRGGKPATNRLSYGAASFDVTISHISLTQLNNRTNAELQKILSLILIRNT